MEIKELILNEEEEKIFNRIRLELKKYNVIGNDSFIVMKAIILGFEAGKKLRKDEDKCQ